MHVFRGERTLSLGLGFVSIGILLSAGAVTSDQGSGCGPCECHTLYRSGELANARVKLANCSGRGLTEIPETLPYDIEQLDLSGNSLAADFGATYTNLWRYNSTKAVIVANTGLKGLPGDLFRNSTKLQFVDVRGDLLDTLPPGLFASTPLLVEVAGLDVRAIPAGAFRGLAKLKRLQLALHQLHVPAALFTGLHLKQLELEVTEVVGLPAWLLYGGRNSLLEVSIAGRRLEELPGDLFRDLDLRQVALRLPSTHTLPEELFQKYSGTVSLLKDVTITGVKMLPAALFKDHLNLHFLRLHDIGQIPDQLFAGLIRLDLLDLSHNRLSMVQQSWFSDFGSGLKTLLLCHNRLQSLGAGNLTLLESLEHLDVSHNHISDVHQAAFQPFHNSVRLLNLSHNRICHLPETVFSSLWQLQVLRLDGNCLSHLPPPLFSDLMELRELYIQENNLQVLPEGLLDPLAMLETLNMSSAGLKVIPRDALVGMEFLRLLDVSNNTIGHLPIRLLPSRPGLKEVYLGENPLHCDCGVVLFTVLYRLHLTDRLSGACASPASVAGHALADLNLNMVCQLETMTEELPGELSAHWDAGSGLATGAPSTVTNLLPRTGDQLPPGNGHAGAGNHVTVQADGAGAEARNHVTVAGGKRSAGAVRREEEAAEGGDPGTGGDHTGPLVAAGCGLLLCALLGAAGYKVYRARRHAGSYTVNRA